MNPLTNVKNTQKLNETELELGLVGSKSSWHEDFKDSAWIFVGGLPYDLTEGDVICVFSQYGEIVHINLVRDKQTGKSKGFCFLCYEDQRSTILAVDNLNSIKLLGRTIRVNHVAEYKMPKEHEDDDEVTVKLREEGCAPKIVDEGDEGVTGEEHNSPKKESKKEKKKKKKNKKKSHEVETTSDQDATPEVMRSQLNREAPGKIKQERYDPRYDKYNRQVDRDCSKDSDSSSRVRNELRIKSEPGHGTQDRDHHDSEHGCGTQARDHRDSERGHRKQDRDYRDYGSDKYRQQSSDREKEHKNERRSSKTSERSEDYRKHSGSSRSRDHGHDDVKREQKHSYSDDDDDDYDDRRRQSGSTSSQERYSSLSRSRDVDRQHKSEHSQDRSDQTRKVSRDYDYSSRYDRHNSSSQRAEREHPTHRGRERHEKDHRTHSPRTEKHRSRSPRPRSERMRITVEIEK